MSNMDLGVEPSLDDSCPICGNVCGNLSPSGGCRQEGEEPPEPDGDDCYDDERADMVADRHFSD